MMHVLRGRQSGVRLARSFSAVAQQPTSVSTLPNGMRVASESNGGETATVGVWIETGSRYESDSNNGVAHFLEHMAFKGTGKRSQLQLETEVENMGAHLNAYTSREQTVYYAKVLKGDVPKAVEMLSDILLNSSFSQARMRMLPPSPPPTPPPTHTHHHHHHHHHHTPTPPLLQPSPPGTAAYPQRIASPPRSPPTPLDAPFFPSDPPQAAVERERDVILREMEEVESQIEEVVFDRLHEVAYVGTPLARTILGPVENINSIMADDIVKYVKTHYTAPRMVLAAAGAVDHDELATLAGDYFGGVPTVAPEGLSYESLPSLFTGSDVREYNDDMPVAHFALAFEGASSLATSPHPESSQALQKRSACAHLARGPPQTPNAARVAGLSWTHPDVFPLMLCQSLLGAVDKKNSSGKFTSSPLAKYLARDGLAESMQPFCARPLFETAHRPGWRVGAGWGAVGGEGYGRPVSAPAGPGTEGVASRVQTRPPCLWGGCDQGGSALLTPLHRARTGTCYNDTGLFGVYFTANMEDKYKTHDLFHHVQEEMVALTTGVGDEDVVRV
jgi:hypothetical protein